MSAFFENMGAAYSAGLREVGVLSSVGKDFRAYDRIKDSFIQDIKGNAGEATLAAKAAAIKELMGRSPTESLNFFDVGKVPKLDRFLSTLRRDPDYVEGTDWLPQYRRWVLSAGAQSSTVGPAPTLAAAPAVIPTLKPYTGK
jgi:hypothetical protein